MFSLSQLVDGVRFLGWDLVRKSIRFAGYRDRWSPKLHAPPTAPSPIGALVRTRDIERGVELTFQNAALEVAFLTDDMVRLTWSPGKRVPDYALARHTWPAVKLRRTQAEDGVVLSTSRMSLRLAQTGAAAYFNSLGRLLRMDDPPGLFGEGWIQQGPLRPDERIFGFGERAAGLNLRPGRYRLWNEDPSGGYLPRHDPLYMSIPVYSGLHQDGAYMVFYNNPHDGYVALGERSEVAFSAGELATYFIAGPLETALHRFLELTGRPPMPRAGPSDCTSLAGDTGLRSRSKLSWMVIASTNCPLAPCISISTTCAGIEFSLWIESGFPIFRVWLRSCTMPEFALSPSSTRGSSR